MTNSATLNYRWSSRIVKNLYKYGVRDVCISPGSRNTPLSLAFIDHPNIKCISHIDERSGGFFGLGIALKKQSPVVLVCTSGTATANYLPSIIEANQSRVPLIILTADRPAYLQGTGANQTIDQNNIYGYHVRNFNDLGLPSDDKLVNIDLIISNTLKIAEGKNISGKPTSPKGPVHINIPFEEPLYFENRLKINNKQIKIKESREYISPSSFVRKINFPRFKYPIIICGRLQSDSDRENIFNLSSALNAPIFADPLSQIRYGNTHSNLVSSYSHFLSLVTLTPDFIIRIGQKPISKTLCAKLDEWDDFTFLIDESGRFNDDCSNVINSSVADFVKTVMTKSISSKLKWKEKIIDIDYKINNFISKNYMNYWFEGSIVKNCFDSLDNGDNFFIGNSMPIRDVDLFVFESAKSIKTYSNRGASGIDGIVSSALGVAYGSENNSLLVLGDLSFYHDMNGLLAGLRYNINITIVIINNNGGGIFSFLPVSKENNKSFEEFWATSHSLKFDYVAKLYDCQYEIVNSNQTLKSALDKFNKLKGVKIIEAKIDRNENIRKHNEIKKSIQKLKV